MIAESYAEYMAGRTYVYDVARKLNLSSYGNGLQADSAKLYCAPIAKRVADNAIQVLGGNGYTAEYLVSLSLFYFLYIIISHSYFLFI